VNLWSWTHSVSWTQEQIRVTKLPGTEARISSKTYLPKSAEKTLLQSNINTRMMCYRTDYRVMCPIAYTSREIFESPQSPSTPMATFQEIFNGLLFLCMCIQNLKFVALPVPEIIGGTLASPWICLWSLFFSHKFLQGFCSAAPCECTGQTRSP